MIERIARLLRGTSTRTRLTIAIAGIVLAALVGTFFAVYQRTGSDLSGQVDRDLSEDVSATRSAHWGSSRRLGRRDLPARPGLHQLAADLRAGFGAALGREGRRRRSRDQRARTPGRRQGARREKSSEASAEARQSKEILAAPDGYSTIELAEAGNVRLLTRPLFTGDREAGQITVGQPLSSVEAAQSGVARAFLVAGSVAFVAALIAVVLVASRSTRPVRRMATVAGAVDAGELSTRMEPEGPVEARRLAESFNHMLDRLEEAFARQRGFMSDASHELRTPLTAIRGQIEVLSRSSHQTPRREEVGRHRGGGYSGGRSHGAARGGHAAASATRRRARARPASRQPSRRSSPMPSRVWRTASTATSRCGRRREGRSPPIATASPRSSETSSATRSSTPPRAASSTSPPPRARMAPSRSASPTTARESPWRIASGSSSASIEWSVPAIARAAVRGSGSRSPGQSSRPTAGASGPKMRRSGGARIMFRLPEYGAKTPSGAPALRLPSLFAEFSYIELTGA